VLTFQEAKDENFYLPLAANSNIQITLYGGSGAVILRIKKNGMRFSLTLKGTH